MNDPHPNSDQALHELLRAARPKVSVPVGFRNEVWQRLDRLERREDSGASNWLTRLATLIVQPRLAASLALVMVCLGIGIGAVQGRAAARQAAQARYLAAIAPSPIR